MTAGEPRRWSLTLYVNGSSPQSVAAVHTMQELLAQQEPGRIELSIVDVSERPALAIVDQVIAVPTLVRRMPEPVRRLVGQLADPGRVRLALDLARDLDPSAGAEHSQNEPGPAEGGPS